MSTFSVLFKMFYFILHWLSDLRFVFIMPDKKCGYKEPTVEKASFPNFPYCSAASQLPTTEKFSP